MQIIAIIFMIFLSGCSLFQPKIAQIGEKSFPEEDVLILMALNYQNSERYKNSIEIYKELYNKSGKINYLLEATKISFLTNNPKLTKLLLKEGLSKVPNNIKFQRVEIAFLIKQKRYKESEIKALALVKKDKSVTHLKIAGSIYQHEKQYELALKYFESAYKINSDENSLLHIVDVQYNYLNKKDSAIALLETHIRMNNCEINSCFKLIEIYGKEKNINGIISTYKKLYHRYKDEEYAKKVIELLIYAKNKNGAISFLEKSGYNQEMLLDIYLSSKDYKGAYKVAKRLYEKSSKVKYLGRVAIYEYELNKNNLTKEILKSISDKFDIVVSKIHDSLYYNYYGYLLIDHNIDIEKGIGLIQEALLKEPNSPFYLDSLAWGYYKQGKCKEAKVIMDKLIKFNNEPELMEHAKKIDSCIKSTKKKRK